MSEITSLHPTHKMYSKIDHSIKKFTFFAHDNISHNSLVTWTFYKISMMISTFRRIRWCYCTYWQIKQYGFSIDSSFGLAFSIESNFETMQIELLISFSTDYMYFSELWILTHQSWSQNYDLFKQKFLWNT